MIKTILNKEQDQCPNCKFYNKPSTNWQPNNAEIVSNYECFNCKCKWDARFEVEKSN